MALTVYPKQALGFIPSRGCACNSRYCQPWRTDDSFMLQGQVTGAHFDNLISDGEFDAADNWDLGAGWSIGAGDLNATNISGTTATSKAPIGLVEGKLYLVQARIVVTSPGSSVSNEGFIIKINDEALALPGGLTAYRNNLQAVWLYRPGAITTDVVEFSTNESTIDFTVSYIRVYELSEVGLALYNGDTILEDITEFTGDNALKYYFNGAHFTTTSAVMETTSAIQDIEILWELFVNRWDSITDYTGCLTARFYDVTFNRDRIRNGDFEIDMGSASIIQYWTNGNHWTRFDAGGGDHSAKFTQDGVLAGTQIHQKAWCLGGNVYTLSFGYVIDFGFSFAVKTSINGAAATTVGTFTALGTGNVTIDLSAYSGPVSVRVYFEALNADHDIGIDNVTLTANEHDAVYETHCLSIQPTQPCTIKLYAVNLDNAFGFDYVTGALRHYLRVYGKIKHSGYPEERDDFVFSDNTSELLYARSEKEFEVTIGDAPEAVHDCIAIMRLHDIFQIDDDPYIPSGNYDLKSRKSSDNSQAVFQVKETTGVGANYSCA